MTAVAAARGSRDAFEPVGRLTSGLGTALLAALALVVVIPVVLSCLVGIGFVLLTPILTTVRSIADRERHRLGRWGHELPSPYQDRAASRWRSLTDPAVRRDLAWLSWHGTLGLILGILGIFLPLLIIREITFPLWWWLLPADEVKTGLGFLVHGWPGAIAVGLMGVGWLALLVAAGPRLAWLQELPGTRLLGPHRSVDMSERIARLTSTRAGALQAHAAELRRIERSLHDGAQSRLVGVTVFLGAARRALTRDHAEAEAAIDRAQTAAEEALAELRTVVRGILPPVLEKRGLAGALDALAAACAIPCRVTADRLGRLPVSVEATAYFVVAEALTNVSRHSRASEATVDIRTADEILRIEVRDKGCGGARERPGSGIEGIRGRVAAHDGTVALTSPAGGPTVLTAELPCAS